METGICLEVDVRRRAGDGQQLQANTKATFKIRGEFVDPDVVCGDPPPTAAAGA